MTDDIEIGEVRYFYTQWKALKVKGCQVKVLRREADTVIVDFIHVPDDGGDYDQPRRWSADYLSKCSVRVGGISPVYGDDPF